MQKTYFVGEGANAFSRIEQALDAARMERRDGDIVIKIRGRYQVDAPVVIHSEMANVNGYALRIEGEDGAVISGGRIIANFEQWKKNIYRAHVPQVEYTRHLFIDSQPARRPHTEVRKPYSWEKLETTEYEFYGEHRDYDLRRYERGELSEYKAIATTDVRVLSWRNPRDIELVFETGWTHCIVPIDQTCVALDGRALIIPRQPAFRICQLKDGVQIGATPNYYENVFELLGEKPNEWYFDRAERMLYVALAEGDLPQNHEIVIPMVEQLLCVEGNPNEKPCNLTIRNIAFRHSTYLRPQRYGHPEIQANVLVSEDAVRCRLEGRTSLEGYEITPSAVQVRGWRGVTFENCRFEMLGSGALDISRGAEDVCVRNCEFTQLAGSAMQIAEFSLASAHPSNPNEIVRKVDVCNNYIHHTGFDYKGSAGILVGYAQDITIAHNDICYVPYSAVSVGWGWAIADMTMDDRTNHRVEDAFPRWKEPSVCKRNRVMYNHIHHAMMLLNDGGAVYTLGYMEGSAIIGNLIHESAGFHGDGFDKFCMNGIQQEEIYDPASGPFWKLQGVPGGIYMDEGSAGIEVCDNVLYDIAIPLFYHNQILNGFAKVSVHDNLLNVRPEDARFPQAIADSVGRQPGEQ